MDNQGSTGKKKLITECIAQSLAKELKRFNGFASNSATKENDGSGRKKKLLPEGLMVAFDMDFKLIKDASNSGTKPKAGSAGKRKLMIESMASSIDKELKRFNAQQKGHAISDKKDEFNGNKKRLNNSSSNSLKRRKLSSISNNFQDKPKAKKKLFTMNESKIKLKQNDPPKEKVKSPFAIKMRKVSLCMKENKSKLSSAKSYQLKETEDSNGCKNTLDLFKVKSENASTPMKMARKPKSVNKMEKVDELDLNVTSSKSNWEGDMSAHENTFEFEKMEQMCGLNIPDVETSPLTTITNTLKRTSLNNISPMKFQEIISLKEEMESDFKIYNEQIEDQLQKIKKLQQDYQKNFELNIKKMDSYINLGNKKNKTFKSPKKQFASPKEQCVNLNLRKATLNKNYMKATVSNTDNLKWEKSVDLYNTFRNNYDVLSTPKANKAMLETPKLGGSKNELSVKLQKQCLMLLDTPERDQ